MRAFLQAFFGRTFSAAFVCIIIAAWLVTPHIETWAYVAIWVPLYLGEAVGAHWANREATRIDSSSRRRAA